MTTTSAAALHPRESGTERREAARLSGKIVLDGRLQPALASELFAVENPAEETEIGNAPRCGAKDVNRAVASARSAFRSWRRVSARERGNRLRRLADALEAEGEGLARLLALETGNALSTQARPEIGAMVEMFRYFAGVATEIKGTTVPWSDGTLCYTTREPLGVVGAIIPWNAPLFLTAVKLGPSLAAGNTAVIKAAEQAPLAVLRCLEIMQEFLPPGVANYVSGFGEEAGKPLAEHPHVRKISFTGSCDVGRMILRYAADKFCPVTLELGGKSPNIIMRDADLDLAANGILTGMRFTRQGQSCSAGSRIYIHEDVFDDVIGRAIKLMAGLKIGSPLDEATQVGSLISREQYERVLGYLDLARNTNGARILCGGGRPKGDQFGKGYFLEPTIIDGVGGDSPLSKDEIFGPVATAYRWREFDQVLADANDTSFGLAATIWTSDLAAALRFAQEIEAGFVQVNQFITPRAGLSYGGMKTSGMGRENTLESAIDHFTASKTVIINPAGKS
jgi:acyl-CoA reductase-like NAD-dependent aldehyde dehydrogenase